MEKELKHCPKCIQMTNHLEDVCQKCKPNSDWREEWDKEIQKLSDIFYDSNDGYGALEKYLVSEENFLCANEIYPESFYELDPDKVKSFISSTIQNEVDKAKEQHNEDCTREEWMKAQTDKAVKEREEELVEKINEYGTQMQGSNPLPTVQQAVIQGVLTIITSPTRATMENEE